jgi:hypothetical protein
MRLLAVIVVASLSMLAAFALTIRGEGVLFDRGVVLPIFRRLLVDDLSALPVGAVTGLLGVVGALMAGKRRLSLCWLADHPRVVAGATTAICLLISLTAYQRHPLAMDESVPVFQARVFAAGQLSSNYDVGALRWLFFPPFLGGFFTASTGGEVTSVYGPGFALALAPFELLGVGFVLNPLLAGASAWLLRDVALDISEGDRDASGLAMAMLLCSPAFLVNGASFYSMNAHLFANLAFVWLLLKPSTRRLVAAGALGGWALALHNPFPHLLFAWPWWLALLFGRQGVRRMAGLAAGYLVVGGLLVVGWNTFRGGLRPPNPVGGGAFPFVVPNLEVLGLRWLGLGKLMAWAPFALLPLAVLGACSSWSNRRVRCLVLSAVSTFAGYLIVTFDQGHGWGYRYFHSAYATLPLLAAFSLAAGRAGSVGNQRLLGNACALWAIAALLVLLPQRVFQVDSLMAAHLRQRVDTSHSEHECVHFVRGDGYYSADLIQNHPTLSGRELYLTDHGEAETRQLLSRHFSDAKLYGRTRSDTAFCGSSLDGLKAAFLGSAFASRDRRD